METIAQSDGYLIQLQLFVEPRGKLSQFGFVTLPLTDEELLLKRRCLGCGKCESILYVPLLNANTRQQCRSLRVARGRYLVNQHQHRQQAV